MKKRGLLILMCAVAVSLGGGTVRAGGPPAETPEQLVATYDSLADAILGLKKAEWHLCHSILSGTYSHAQGAVAEAKAKMKAGQDARPAIERLATLVSQLGNEGDAAVAAVRKRLVEAGHHHHSTAEKEGVYDEGFVIVTRKAKKALLDAAKEIGQLASRPDAAALDAAWQKVEREFKELHKNVPMGG